MQGRMLRPDPSSTANLKLQYSIYPSFIRSWLCITFIASVRVAVSKVAVSICARANLISGQAGGLSLLSEGGNHDHHALVRPRCTRRLGSQKALLVRLSRQETLVSKTFGHLHDFAMVASLKTLFCLFCAA